MITLSKALTAGQVTFILRIVIQALSYLGLYLLGYIVVGNAPRIAPLETHHLLNRFVGQSTATLAALQWIWKRIFKKNSDPIRPLTLIVAFTLWILYGFLVSLSDVSLVGIHSCTVPGPSHLDFPASIKSDDDALAAVSANIFGGVDPHSVNSYRCEASHVVNATLDSEWECTALYNSTYGDGSTFRVLNSTDSDVLMPKSLLRYTYNDSTYSGFNMYTFQSADSITEPMIQGGIAYLPEDTKATIIVGVPLLEKQQKVQIPKTLALEVDTGCLSLGIYGTWNDIGINIVEHYFIPDSLYLPQRMSMNYSGPENLRAPLANTADQIRSYLLPLYNTAAAEIGQFYRLLNASTTPGSFTKVTQISNWTPPASLNISTSALSDVLSNCSVEIQQMLNISTISDGVAYGDRFDCQALLFTGSSFQGESPVKKYTMMICAATTQFNMVSASLEIDQDGTLSTSVTPVGSDLNLLQARQVVSLLTGNFIDPLIRFTLSDNPTGPLNHYIYQQNPFVATEVDFVPRTGIAGATLTKVGPVGLTYNGDSQGLINQSFFSANFSPTEVTRYAGGRTLSYLLGTIAYNGWVARGSQPLVIESTGGYPATCYSGWYAVAFLPLLLAALVLFCWILVMLFRAQLKAAARLQDLYGGLKPTIDPPFPGKLPSHTWLEWEEEPEPHLRPAVDRLPFDDMADVVMLVPKDTGRSSEDDSTSSNR